MKARFFWTCVVVVLCAALAPAVPQRVDVAKEREIHRMIALMGGEEAFRESVAQMQEAAQRDLQRKLPAGERSRQFLDAYRERLARQFDYHAMLEASVPVYDRYFTLEDIQELNQFYESRVGQRYIRVMPQFSAELVGVSLRYQRELNQKVLATLLDEYPEFRAPQQATATAKP